MRKMYHLLAVLFCFFSFQGYSQVTYSENFDAGLNGWTTVGGWTAAHTTVQPCTGAGSIAINLWSGDDANITTSPSVGTSNGGLITLNYAYKLLDYASGAPGGPTANPWGTILVQYATSASGPWTTVQTVNSSNHTSSGTCTTKTATFTPPSGDLYIRFNASWTDGDYYIYYDDVNITQGPPPACATPTNLGSNTVTSTGANITWDASTSGTASGYQWEIRTSGVGGSGATGLVANGSTTAATLTASTSALTANTSYNVYVRTDCGGSFSDWFGPYSFTTPCTTATLPYVQDFQSAVVPGMPPCTSRENAGTGNNWITSSTSSTGFTTKHLRYEYNSANAADAWFYLQPISLTAGTSYRLKFKYGNNSTTYIEKLEVKYGTSPANASMTDLIVDHPSISINAQATSSTDFTPAVSGVYYIGFHVYSAADQFNLFVDDIMVMVTPTCEEPTALVFSNVTANSVQLDWTAPAVTSPVDYQIYYNTTNTPPTSGTTPNILNAQSPANITSLAPGTKYYVWVRSDCGAGSGVSIWTTVDSVTTECAPVTTLNENFDGVTTPALPACWGKLLRGTAGTPNVTTSTASANSTPNAVLLANSSSTATADIMLVSPPLSNVGAGTHRLRFWARNATATQDIEVGTLDNKGPSAIFTLVQAIDINTTYAEYIVDFSVYAGTDPYIAIRRLSTSTFTSVYIDNFVWEAIPTCDAPTLPVIANITSTGAEVSWTAPTVGSPVDYQIYYSITNTAPTGASTPNVTGASAPATLTGLTPNTLYYVWIRTNCGAGGLSTWSALASFRTACTPVSTLPWTENFDALTTVGTTNFPDCWKEENGDWTTANAATDTRTDPRSAPNYLRNSWNATDEYMWTPGFQLTAGTSYDFSFWWVGDGFTGWTGDVFYNTDQNSMNATQMGTSFIATATTAPTAYGQFKESFTPPTTGVYYFAIRINANGNPWYLGFDDFKLEVTPTCAEPSALTISNLTTSTAQLDWTAPVTGSPINYQVYVDVTNTAPTSGSTPTLTGQNSPSSITGLTANTTYYVWVRSNCGGTDLSSWAGPVTFTTACDAATLPYTQNFESATVPNMPLCTMRENAGTGNNWVTANAPGSGFTSKTLRYTYNSTNAANAWFYTQGLNLTGGTSYRITYRYGSNSATTYIEKMEVKYGTSPGSASMTDLIYDHTSIQGTTPQNAVYDFTPATTGVYYIGFHAYSDIDQNSLFVDDISVYATPTCNEPTGVAVSNVTTTGAQVDWTPPTVGTPASYQIYYSTINTAPTGSSTPNLTGITGTSTNLTGLTPATTYYLWMRSFCGGTDNSIWTSTAVMFTTPCVGTTNYVQNFDGVTAPALPNCWSKVGTTGLVNTQTANNNSSPNTLYIYSSTASNIAMVSLPPVTNLSTGTNTLRFKARGNFTAGETIEVGYLTAPGDASSFVMIQPVVVSTLTYQDYVITIPALAAGVEILAIRHTSTISASVLIDDVAYDVALPVTLIDFRGEKAGSFNKLIWSTSTEINNRGFELERSADGRNFTALSFVASKAENGNSNSTLNYNFNDARPLSGNNYYRLKQIDRDGKITYSDIVVLKSKVSDITLSSVYPNPATRELKMIITSPTAEKVMIVVTDLTGKVIMQQSAQLVIGDNQSQINVQQLAAGTYLVKAICANGCETAVQRFVKH